MALCLQVPASVIKQVTINTFHWKLSELFIRYKISVPKLLVQPTNLTPQSLGSCGTDERDRLTSSRCRRISERLWHVISQVLGLLDHVNISSWLLWKWGVNKDINFIPMESGVLLRILFVSRVPGFPRSEGWGSKVVSLVHSSKQRLFAFGCLLAISQTV